MVSGLAMQAISRRALLPTRFPISARVTRSGSDSRRRAGSFLRRIRSPPPDTHSAQAAPGSPSWPRRPTAVPICRSSLPVYLTQSRAVRVCWPYGITISEGTSFDYGPDSNEAPRRETRCIKRWSADLRFNDSELDARRGPNLQDSAFDTAGSV
jgi:hypothetical protein